MNKLKFLCVFIFLGCYISTAQNALSEEERRKHINEFVSLLNEIEENSLECSKIKSSEKTLLKAEKMLQKKIETFKKGVKEPQYLDQISMAFKMDFNKAQESYNISKEFCSYFGANNVFKSKDEMLELQNVFNQLDGFAEIVGYVQIYIDDANELTKSILADGDDVEGFVSKRENVSYFKELLPRLKKEKESFLPEFDKINKLYESLTSAQQNVVLKMYGESLSGRFETLDKKGINKGNLKLISDITSISILGKQLDLALIKLDEEDKKSEENAVIAKANAGCIEGDCLNGTGVKEFSDATFKGDFKNGEFHGKGTLSLNKGGGYSGSWLEGKPNGNGIMEFPNGNIYNGEFVKGIQEGYGTYIFENGAKIEGEWVNNKIEGKATFKYLNGDFYSGDWIADKKEGYGVFTYANGSIYSGEWQRDKYHGEGTFESEDGEIYVGEWYKGNKQGFGTYEGFGAKYVGEWRGDSKSGQGTYVYPNGSKYIGEWSSDVREGNGVMFYHYGDTFDGRWYNDERVDGKLEFANGAVYNGEFENDKIEGFGKFKFKDNDYFEGEFEDGERKNGRSYTKNGELVYRGTHRSDGTFLKGKAYSNGKIIFSGEFRPDGSWLKGTVEDSNDKRYYIVGSFNKYNVLHGFAKAYEYSDSYYSFGAYGKLVLSGYFKNGDLDKSRPHTFYEDAKKGSLLSPTVHKQIGY